MAETAFEKNRRHQKSSGERLFGRHVIYGKEAEHATPYMTRYWFGRLRLHIFHRGDQDPDCHDHPWDFWTFPLTSYVEEVAAYSSAAAMSQMQRDTMERLRSMVRTGAIAALAGEEMSQPTPEPVNENRRYGYYLTRQVVPTFRLSFRPAHHTHRVLGRYKPDHSEEIYGPSVAPGKIITIVWCSRRKRDWGFLKKRDGKWCWVAWREYVFGGGKSAPCE